MERANIILSPHFDDAALSLGGLLAKEGNSTIVATFFAGTPSEPEVRQWDLSCGFKDSSEAVFMRTKENESSLLSFGVTRGNIRNYTFLDQQYRSPISYIGFPEKELEGKIEAEINKLLEVCPNAKIFAPGLEMHRDHALVKRAFLNVFNTNRNNTDSVEYFLYQDLPYAVWTMEKDNKHFEDLKELVTKNEFEVSEKIIELSKKDIEKKVEGIALFASQIEPLGSNLLQQIEEFASQQAQSKNPPSDYCEVVYQVQK